MQTNNYYVLDSTATFSFPGPDWHATGHATISNQPTAVVLNASLAKRRSEWHTVERAVWYSSFIPCFLTFASPRWHRESRKKGRWSETLWMTHPITVVVLMPVSCHLSRHSQASCSVFWMMLRCCRDHKGQTLLTVYYQSIKHIFVKYVITCSRDNLVKQAQMYIWLLKMKCFHACYLVSSEKAHRRS